MANEFKIKKGLIVTGASGGTVVDIQGSQGQLFSVTDNLSGSIFAVSDISGVPILDVNSSGLSTFDGDVNLPDNKKILLGTGNDLEIYHDASHSYIKDIGVGDLKISSNTVRIESNAAENMIIAIANGGVSSYYNNVKKFETTSTGVNVTGGATITGTNTFLIESNSTAATFNLNSTVRGFDFINNNATLLSIDNDGNGTFADQAFATTATSSGDASSTLTTKGYVDGLITGATIYRGAWDPSGGGYGSPDLSGVTQTSGYYYICSAAGTAEPNGTGTEPDTWAVGDWVIYNDVSGTGQWQKIDNSSVLSGVGTGQTVALWEGAGSVTDSETLGNAPITVSGNDTTFGGNITTSGTNATVFADRFSGLGVGAVIGPNGAGTVFLRPSGVGSSTNQSSFTTTLATIGTDATFAGDVVINSAGDATSPILRLNNSSSNTFNHALEAINDNLTAAQTELLLFGKETNNRNSGFIGYNWNADNSETNYVTIGHWGYNHLLKIYPTGTATFVGAVTSPTFLGDLNGTINTATTGVTQTAGDNSTLIATTAYADAAAAAVPIGNYLPLAGGTMTGVTQFNDHTNYGDQVYARFGASQDLQIFHNGTDSFIDNYTGSLTIRNRQDDGNIVFTCDDGSGGLASYLTLNGNSTHAYFTNPGNVGIGTTSPSSKLNVIGGSGDDIIAKFKTTGTGTGDYSEIHILNDNNDALKIGSIGSNYTNSSWAGMRYVYAGSGDLGLKAVAGTGNVRIYAGGAGSERMRITSGGNVGIGTTSPGYKLSVNGDIHIPQNEYIYFDNTAHYIRRGSSDVELQGFNGLNLRTNGSSRLYIKQDGNVGIGTTLPGSKLELYEVSGGAPTLLTLHQNAVDIVADDSMGSFIDFKSTDINANFTPQARIGMLIRDSNGDNGVISEGCGNLVFHTSRGTDAAGAGEDVERMRITDIGNVGIGTSTPNAKLDVQGTQGQLFSVTDDLSGDIFSVADISGVPIMNVNSDGTSYFDGNVGIGTDSPDNKLFVTASTAGDYAAFIENTNSTNGYGLLARTAQTGTSSYAFAARAGSSDIFVVRGDGNVGIGTASPNTKLHVAGIAQVTESGNSAFYGGNYVRVFGDQNYGFRNTGGTYIANISMSGNSYFNGGNVGIGTTSPGAKLEISQGAGGTAQNVINSGEQAFRFSTKVEDTSTNTAVFRQGIYYNNTENATIAFYRGGSSVGGFMTFQTQNGNERMRIDSVGNVGIGTTSPATKLEVNGGTDAIVTITGTTTAARLDIKTDSYHRFLQTIESDGRFRLYNQTTATEQLTVTNAGNVGIGTASPDDMLEVYGSSPNIRVTNTAETDAGIVFNDAQAGTGQMAAIKFNSSDEKLKFFVNDETSQRMVIDTAGNVGIGPTISPSYLLDVRDGTTSGAIARFSAINAHVVIESSTAGNAVLHLKPNATGSKFGQFKVTAGNGYGFSWSNDAAGTGETTYMDLDTSSTGGGDLTVKGDVIAYGSPSDKKYKENIKPIESALGKAMQLQGVTFDWKDSDSILDIKEDIGFIAQDVQEVLPELVRDSGKGNLSLRYQGITPILLEAIKELKAEIDLLKSKPCNCNNCNCNI